MGTVGKYQTSKGVRWYYAYDGERDAEGNRRQIKRRGFATKKAAEAAMQRVLVARRDGDWIEPSPEPLRVYLARWLEETEQSRAPGTNANYARHITRINKHIGTIPLGKLSAIDIQRAERLLLAEYAPTTVKVSHRVLSAALKQAVRWRLIPRDPCAGVTPHQVPVEDVAIWTTEEARMFLTHVADDPLHALWRLYLDTGMRATEALALQWGDVDLEAGSLWIHRTLATDDRGKVRPKLGCKHGSDRRVEIMVESVAALRRHRITQHERRLAHGAWVDHGLIFDRHDGHWFDVATIRERLARRCEGAGVPVIQLKGLRHTAATIMVAHGVPLHAVAQRLGHSTIKLTADLYAHHTREAGQKAVKTLSEALKLG